MSTRATYSFELKYNVGEWIHYYIHWDGYPAGAACYFNKMVCLLEEEQGADGRMSKKKKNGLNRVDINAGYAELFFVANSSQIEIIADSTQISDIEYKYELKANGHLTVTDIINRKIEEYSQCTDFIKKFIPAQTTSVEIE